MTDEAGGRPDRYVEFFDRIANARTEQELAAVERDMEAMREDPRYRDLVESLAMARAWPAKQVDDPGP